MQDKFSWAGVAAAGVGGGFGNLAGLELGDSFSGLGETAGNIASRTGVGTASAIASAATRSALDGSSFEDGIRAAIPDVIGSAIGASIGNGISSALSALNERATGDPVAVEWPIPIEGFADDPLAIGRLYEDAFGDGLRLSNFPAEGIYDADERFLEGYNEDYLWTRAEEILAEDRLSRALSGSDSVSEDGLIGSALGSLAFGAGIVVGAGYRAAEGLGGLASFGSNVLGTALYFVQDGANALTGQSGNPFRGSWLALQYGERAFKTSVGAVWDDPAGEWNEFWANKSIEAQISGARGTAFERGFSNPYWALATDVGVPAATLAKVGRIGRSTSVASASGPVDTLAALQMMTDRAVIQLADNPALAGDFMSPGSYRHLVERTNLAYASYGKAVERLTASLISRDETLSGLFTYQSKPFVSTPDFIAYEGQNFRLLDITTQTSLSNHLNRSYGPYTEYVFHPGLPAELVFPE